MRKISLMLLAITCSVAVFAQEKLSTKSVNVFKNGSYFIVKEGNVNATSGNFRMAVPSSPLLATYWITMADNKVKRMDVKQDTIKVSTGINFLTDLLRSNKGKNMRLTYAIAGKDGSEPRTVKGKLESYNTNSGLIRMRTAEGTVFVYSSGVSEVIMEESFSDKAEKDSLAIVATFHMEKADKSVPVRLSYMHTGMNWMPSYNIRLLDDKKLQLEMKALIENYSESFKDADMTLTLGAANFKYAHQIDPIALTALSGGTDYSLRTYDNYAMQSNYNQMYANGAGYASDILDSDGPAFNVNSNFGTEGEKSHDLFTYKLGKVSIEKNMKSTFSIFSAPLPYEHVYEVSLYDHVNYETNKGINNQDNQQNTVYHSLCITNSTQYPLTTGPVFVQDENMSPLAQDQVKYTPVNGEAKVQIAKATDVQVKNSEEEISSEEKAKKVGSYYYKKVIIKGTITVENLQKKAVKMKVDKTIRGDITTTSDKGDIKKTGKYSGTNPTSTANWTVDVAAGAKKTITYEYNVYVYEGY